MDKELFLAREYIKFLENYIIYNSNYQYNEQIKKDFAIDFCLNNDNYKEFLNIKL